MVLYGKTPLTDTVTSNPKAPRAPNASALQVLLLRSKVTPEILRDVGLDGLLGPQKRLRVLGDGFGVISAVFFFFFKRFFVKCFRRFLEDFLGCLEMDFILGFFG